MDEPISLDQAFINKLTGIIEVNLTNEQFGVEELYRRMGMSHTTIHRKLRSYAHRSLSQFIREIRLQKAYGMLQQNLGTISEISFRVGFGSPTYFDKCFHEYYGYPPGDVKRKILPEKADQTEPPKENRTSSDLSGPESGKGLTDRKQSRRRRATWMSAVAIFFSFITIFWISINRSDRLSKDLSIIVLPIKNISDSPDNQYFAEAIMEDILNSLFQISDLRVISRTTSEHFRETSNTTREIAKEVNAHYVLEGTIRPQGDMIRINIQLIDAFQDRHVWSAIYDRKVTDIIDIQNDIAFNVAQKLNIVLSETEIRQIKALPAASPVAND